MTNREETYLTWADPASPWSPWAKPVLFACMDRLAGAPRHALPPGPRDLPDADPATALVVDLPGAEGVEVGIALARRGHRPVPLYNALPAPPATGAPVRSAVDVSSILAELHAATPNLEGLRLPADAPPAFLLDANRRTARFALAAGDFDNRSVCFTTDFPSASLLRARGIVRVLVLERGRGPDVDLARVLADWEAGGLALVRRDLARVGGDAEPFHAPRPRWWRRVWYALAVTLGLRRSALGGFGGMVAGSGG